MCIVEIHEMKQGQIQSKRRPTTSDKTCWDTLQIKIPIFCTYPDKNAYRHKFEDRFPPPLLQCCLRLQKKCTLGLLSQNNITPGVDRVGGRWICSFWTRWLHGTKLKTALKCLHTFIPGCRLFCGGSEKSCFQWLHKEQFQNFLELYVQRRIYCFFDKVLSLLGNRLRSESMGCFNWNNYSRIPIFRALIFSSLQITRKKSRFPLLSRTLQF